MQGPRTSAKLCELWACVLMVLESLEGFSGSLMEFNANAESREDGEHADARQDLLYVLTEWLFLLCEDRLSRIK